MFLIPTGKIVKSSEDEFVRLYYLLFDRKSSKEKKTMAALTVKVCESAIDRRV